jgi:hypothetical protein
LPLRHPITAHRDIGSLIELVFDPCARDSELASLSAIASATGDQSSVPAQARHPARDPLSETRTRDES